MNTTVRNNITFGMPFDKERYDKVINAVSLIDDLKVDCLSSRHLDAP